MMNLLKYLVLTFLFSNVTYGQFSKEIINEFTFIKVMTDQYKNYFIQLNNQFKIKYDYRENCKAYIDDHDNTVLKICHLDKNLVDRRIDYVKFSTSATSSAYLYIERLGKNLKPLSSQELFKFNLSSLVNENNYKVKIFPNELAYTVAKSEEELKMFISYKGKHHFTLNYKDQHKAKEVIKKVRINCFTCPDLTDLKVSSRQVSDGLWLEKFYVNDLSQAVVPTDFFKVQNFVIRSFIQMGDEFLEKLLNEFDWPQL